MLLNKVSDLIYYIYNLTKANQLGNCRGVWRVRKLLQKQVFSKNKYFKAPYLGHSIFVCPGHSMGKKIFEGGVYEPAIISTIQTFVKNGYSFIDIGANIGLHTLAAAFARVDNDQVFISFEPDKEIFFMLEKNCEINNLSFVKCMQIGVGDKETFLELNVSLTSNKGRSSFLPRENTAPSSPIPIKTLDTLFLNDEVISAKEILIKIDTEGYELPILQGGIQWLSKFENAAIICEVSPLIMAQNVMKVEDLFNLLVIMGFEKYAVYKDDETILDLGTTSYQFNVLFIKGALSEHIFSIIAPRYKWGIGEQ